MNQGLKIGNDARWSGTMRNEKAPCQKIDTDLTREGSRKVLVTDADVMAFYDRIDCRKNLETLAAVYERADAYNRPAIEFVLRQQYGHYTARGE
jgi:hypothetical protein